MEPGSGRVHRRSSFFRHALGVFLAVAVLASAGARPDSGRAQDRSGDAGAAITRGTAYLIARQHADGSWEDHVGFTALAIAALVPTGSETHPGAADAVTRGLAYLDRWARADGGIYQVEHPYYSTAVAVLAFKAAGAAKYQSRIEAARDFLVGLQAREETGFTEAQPGFGGTLIGDGKTNLDATVWVLRALGEARLPPEHPYWARALRFIARCQNWKATNDQPWAGTDGGFIFAPGFSFAGATKSYGTMTYAGLSAYRDAGLRRDDERVEAAFRWLRANFTARENPGLQKQTLYHSYFYMTTTLGRWGVDTFTDGTGMVRSWRRELVEAVLARQQADGGWANVEDPRWYEDKPVLATSFAVKALREATAQNR
jgi:squalene-hopene/tetraprenyl-beta-curcumene cyclase